jgi:hypothetical protein
VKGEVRCDGYGLKTAAERRLSRLDDGALGQLRRGEDSSGSRADKRPKERGRRGVHGSEGGKGSVRGKRGADDDRPLLRARRRGLKGGMGVAPCGGSWVGA